MVDAKQEIEWSRTAHLMALIHNVNTSKKSDAVDGAFYNPYAPKKKATPGTIDALRALLPAGDPNRLAPSGGA